MGSKTKNNFVATRLADASPLKPATSPARRPDPAGARLSPSSSDRAGIIARQRLETLQRFERLKKRQGVTKAAAAVGSSVPSLWRWQKEFTARGIAGLHPKNPSGGRPSAFSKVRLSVKAAREIERLIVSAGNARAAWRQFARSPLCPPLVARHVEQFGAAPARLAAVGRAHLIQATCFISADGRRLLVRLPGVPESEISATKTQSRKIASGALPTHFQGPSGETESRRASGAALRCTGANFACAVGIISLKPANFQNAA